MRDETQGLTPANMKPMMRAAIKSRLLSREVSERRQVGDAESMVNEARRKRETTGEL